MRIEWLKQLLDYTKEQKELLEKEDFEGFGKMMEKKQVVIDAINTYNNEHSEPITDDEMAMLEYIKELDAENNQEFHRQYEEVKLKIRQIRQSKMGNNSYTNPYGVWREEGVFFDRK